MVYKVNDFFCGAGGMGLGFKQAGFEIVGAWDNDKYAYEMYKENVDSKVKLFDIMDLTYKDIPRANVWTFGFPCQDVSTLGKGKGLIEGKNSKMFFKIMDLLQETRNTNSNHLPEIILGENVKGIKKYLNIIEDEYKKVGYRFYFTLYNSKNWGVPQHRERYFLLGVRDDIKGDFEFLQENEREKVKISSIREKNVDKKYLLPEEKQKWLIGLMLKSKPNNVDLEDICIDDQGRIQKEHKVKTIFPTLRAQDHGRPPRLFFEQDGQIYVRNATPREIARAQAFPDTYKIVVSDTQARKVFGNAVTVSVAKAIAEQIKAYLDTYYK